jgi:molybdopterin synthase catalytic subunit
MLIKVCAEPIDINEARAAVHAPTCGAISVFEGTIRKTNQGKAVMGLEYEVFEAFMRAEVERIIQEIQNKWEIHELALIQRTGKLDVGECGIVIAVSSPHRREAIEACAYMIEEFKKRAPVWKKEYYQDHSDWVFCHQSHD